LGTGISRPVLYVVALYRIHVKVIFEQILFILSVLQFCVFVGLGVYVFFVLVKALVLEGCDLVFVAGGISCETAAVTTSHLKTNL
jgi:hypothetical protein